MNMFLSNPIIQDSALGLDRVLLIVFHTDEYLLITFSVLIYILKLSVGSCKQLSWYLSQSLLEGNRCTRTRSAAVLLVTPR